jgi:Class 2 transcription repressor NC2, beta subunit (Dr1)
MTPKRRNGPSSSSSETTKSTKKLKMTSNFTSNLLSPQVFEESLAKLNLRILPPSSGGVVVQDPNTSIETQHNNSLDDENTVQDSTDDIRRNENQQIYCTKEAMEILRHCHGQFIALLASELVSSYCKLCGKESSSCSCDGKGGGGGRGEMGDSIRTIMPKHVKVALEQLEFQPIVSSPKFMEIYARVATEGTHKAQKARANTTKSTRIKKVVKNIAMEEDLLKEQERLFALSAAKMKDASGFGKLT